MPMPRHPDASAGRKGAVDRGNGGYVQRRPPISTPALQSYTGISVPDRSPCEFCGCAPAYSHLGPDMSNSGLRGLPASCAFAIDALKGHTKPVRAASGNVGETIQKSEEHSPSEAAEALHGDLQAAKHMRHENTLLATQGISPVQPKRRGRCGMARSRNAQAQW